MEPTDVRLTEGDPHDQLTILADEMLSLVPEGLRAIVFLEDDVRGGSAFHGFETYDEIAEALGRHARAFGVVRITPRGMG